MSLDNQKGNALLISLAVAAVVAALVETGVQRLATGRLDTMNSRVQSTGQALTTQLSNYSGLASTYRTSVLADPNSAMSQCIVNTSGKLCDGVNEQPTSLYYPVTSQTSGGATPTYRLIASPKSLQGQQSPSQARFDYYGNPCAAGDTSTRCQYQVYASFVAHCLNGALTCVQADNIQLKFLIVNSQSNSSMNIAEAASVSTMQAFNQLINVTFTQLNSSSTANVISPQIAQALDNQGITDPEERQIIAKALVSAGITDSQEMNAFIFDGFGPDDVDTMEQVAAAIAASGVTGNMVYYLARSCSTDSSWDQSIANALQNSGTTNPFILDTFARNGVGDPAYAKSEALVLEAAGLDGTHIMDNAIAFAVVNDSITNVSLIKKMESAINKSGTYNWDLIMAAVSQHLTSVSAITKIADNYGGLYPDQSSSVDTQSSTLSGSQTGSTTTTTDSGPAAPTIASGLPTCSGGLCSGSGL